MFDALSIIIVIVDNTFGNYGLKPVSQNNDSLGVMDLLAQWWSVSQVKGNVLQPKCCGMPILTMNLVAKLLKLPKVL